MRRFSLGLLVAASLFAFPASAAAQSRWDRFGATVFVHVAQDAGLPNAAFPQALAQDADGYLWIGTENGLARWDGYRFRIYKPIVDVPGSLPDSVIDALHADDRGTLWIGTDAHGLVRYDRTRDRFVSVAASGETVVGIADDGSRGVLAATDRGVIAVPRDGRQDGVAGVPVRGLANRDVRALLRDRAGTLWVGTTHGLLRRPAGARAFSRLRFAGTGAAPDIRKLFEDEDGRLWIGTEANGAFVRESAADRAQPIGADRLRATRSITSFAQPRRGVVWIGTGDAGIIAVDVRTRRSRRIVHDPTIGSSLAGATVLDLLRDRSGLTWVATTRSLSFCNAGQTGIITVFGASHTTGGVSGDDVRSVLPLADGRVWVGYARGGADRLDPGAGMRTHITLSASAAEAALRGARALATLPNGDVILGGSSGVFRVPRAASVGGGPSIRGAPLVPQPIRTLRFALGRLWFAGVDHGFWSLDAAGHATLVRDPRSGRPLTRARITLIEPGPGATLWLGTSRGLLRFDPRRGIVERVGVDLADPGALSSGLVTTAVTDRSGRLWVGTQGGGIDVLVARDARGRPQFRRLDTVAGLPNDSIDKLLADRRGTIWASTDAGIAAIDPVTFAVRPFGIADGVGISGYWVDAGARGPSGELYFGGLGGMTVVRPEALAPRTFDAAIVTGEISVGGKRVDPAPRGRAPLAVAPNANNVSIEFAALDMATPQDDRYRYRLLGYDTAWTEVDATHRFAAYTNLPPGAYRFSVRVVDRSGTSDDRSLEIPIVVLPAWYQTPAFALASIVAAFLALAAVVRGRTAYLRRRQRELEREVLARTAQLHATQAELEQMAYRDTLTALPNRRMFAHDFAGLIAAASNGDDAFALVLLDLDGFKAVNDTLGHDAGDAVLVAAAGRLRAAVRATDVVARLGGDEFALLLRGRTTPDDVDAVCRRIVAAFAAPVALASASAVTHASLGAALCPRDGRTQEALYKAADLALYAAKHAGRNTWRWYDGTLGAELRAD